MMSIQKIQIFQKILLSKPHCIYQLINGLKVVEAGGLDNI